MPNSTPSLDRKLKNELAEVSDVKACVSHREMGELVVAAVERNGA